MRIETGGGFVEEQQLRIVEQSQREGETLLLAAGELSVERVALLPEREALQQSVAIHGLRVKIAKEFDSFADFDFFLQIRRLEAHADAILELLALRTGIESKDGDIASRARPQTFEDLYRGRLTRAIRAEKPKHLAGAHFKIDALDGLEIAVVFCEGGDLNDWILDADHSCRLR